MEGGQVLFGSAPKIIFCDGGKVTCGAASVEADYSFQQSKK
jgi:hypothetical protein